MHFWDIFVHIQIVLATTKNKQKTVAILKLVPQKMSRKNDSFPGSDGLLIIHKPCI